MNNEADVMNAGKGVKADCGGHHLCTEMILQFLLCVAVLKALIFIYV